MFLNTDFNGLVRIGHVLEKNHAVNKVCNTITPELFANPINLANVTHTTRLAIIYFTVLCKK